MLLLLATLMHTHAYTTHVDVFVDAKSGNDLADGTNDDPVLTVHAANRRVRALLAARPAVNVTVNLLPGTHHVGTGPLTIGPAEGGSTMHNQWVYVLNAFAAGMPA